MVILHRLEKYTEEIISEYQCSFMKDKFTVDYICTLIEVMEKCCVIWHAESGLIRQVLANKPNTKRPVGRLNQRRIDRGGYEIKRWTVNRKRRELRKLENFGESSKGLNGL